MFFQFSPPVRQVEKKVSILDDSEEVAVLSLAPFTPNPKIFFNNVTVGKTAVRKLTIKNPQNHDIQITVRKDFSEEIALNLSWSQHLIEKNSEVTLELSWTPQNEGSWFYKLNLSDGKRHNRDIPVAFKSVKTKKSTTNKGKKVKGLPKFKVKSPVHNRGKNKSPVKRPILPNITNIPTVTVEPPNHRVISENFGKENRENDLNIGGFSSDFDKIEMETNIRRSTYTVQSNFTKNLNESINSDSVFSDSLEMISPAKNGDVIETKLQSVSFMFSPDVMSQQGTSPLIETFNTSTPHTNHVLICSSSIEKNKTFDLLPKSRDNSIKGNLSTETYVKGNISSETYVQGNISSSTYVKDCSLNGEIANFELSPIHQDIAKPPTKNCVETNWWPFERPNLPLDCITEESMVSENSVNLKRKSNYSYNMTPHKRVTRVSDWSLTGANVRFSKKTTGLTITRENNQNGVSHTDVKEMALKNPFLLAAVENIDPFMTSTLYFSEEWMNEQQENFKKWLNALLTPPAEFDLNEEHVVDFTKIWNECRKKKEVCVAPTREMVSNQYHTSAKLNALRKSALVLFRSTEIVTVLTKVSNAIDSNKLSIRQDREVHLDLSLQTEIMSIFLSYNPLWLRIGLETVYNETIPMSNNADLTTLSCFLLERFFKNPRLLKKFKSVHSVKYTNEIKKFILKKFFSLVYFLDQAKTKKLIRHDPCLFYRKGEIKESKEALIKFARETLSAMGDITKYLKYFGYAVIHKQTYIDEFNYAVTSLGADLRDGVRLTRIMEIILLKNGLSDNLRVPAISRLQKVHNMEIVFDALAAAGFEISEDISPKDIVNGHKEKTLSFLWQIIYKFQAPLMVKSATTIQKWWRSAPVLQKRQCLKEVYERKQEAARKIQKWYRNKKLSARLEKFVALMKVYKEHVRIHRAATKIQSYVKMYLVRKQYITVRKTVVKIQQYSRKWLQIYSYKRHRAAVKIQSYARMFIAKQRYQKLKYCVLFIENLYLANKLMKLAKERFETLKYATLLIQTIFRANRLSRQVRGEFLDLKAATIIVQQRFRAKIAMRTEHTRYKELKNAVITVQRRYRAKLQMKKDMIHFQTIQYSVILIQRYYRAKIAGRIERNKFLQLQKAVLIIQQRYRANIIMKKQREEFAALKKATIVIQRRYRAKLEMRRDLIYFKSLRLATVLIQMRYRAIIIGRTEKHRFTQLKKAVLAIQRRYRANITMKKQREGFKTLQNAALIIQRRYRAKLAMRREILSYQTLRQAAISIQQRYRANRTMKKQRDEFTVLRKAVLVIQRRYRAKLAMKREVLSYQTLRQATVLIQRRYRANIAMKDQLEEFTVLRKTVLLIQSRYRAKLAMMREMLSYQTLRQATVLIQQRYRANIIMKKQRKEFTVLRKTVLVIQRSYRAKLAMRNEMLSYQTLRQATVLIQRRYRANITMKKQREEFIVLRKTVILIQRRYRAKLAMRREMFAFKKLRQATVLIQQHYRATIIGRIERHRFVQLKKAVVVIQQRHRANIIKKNLQKEFAALRKSAIVLQRRYRAKLAMRREMLSFRTLRQATILIQQHYRATVIGRKQRIRFVQLKKAVVVIQQRYRANITMKKQKEEFTALRKAATVIQRRYRAKLAMKRDMLRFKMLRQATILIQQHYRAILSCRTERHRFVQLKKAVVAIQHRHRANIIMKKQRLEFTAVREAAIVIQRKYRAKLTMRKEMLSYKILRQATILIQQRYRARIIGKVERHQFTQLKETIIAIQRRYRANIIMQKQREEFTALRKATLIIQRRYRATLVARREMLCFQTLRRASILIQRCYRARVTGKIERDRFRQLKHATIFIQQRFRSIVLMKTQREEYRKLRNAVLVIQTRYRAVVQMRREMVYYKTLHRTVIFIQRYYRAKIVGRTKRNYFIQIKKSVLFIQQRYRATIIMRKQREEFIRMKKATVVIQRRYKALILMRQEKMLYQRRKEAVLKIQRFFRCAVRSKLRKEDEIRLKAVVIIQKYVRRYLVRKEYAQYLTPEAINERRILRIQNEAAVRIQAAWKGYRSRSVDSPELSTIRERSRKANERAHPKNTLRSRCEDAMNLLIYSNPSLLEIIKAFEDLEFITRRCKDTCLNLSSRIPKQLYVTITSTNRSPPHIKASTLATHILINFWKYPPSRSNCWIPDYIDQLVTAMLHCCDKEEPLFPALCTLFWLFCHKEEYKKVILQSPNFNQKIDRIENLCLRKEHMVMRSSSKCESLFVVKHDLPLPSLTPDWGFEYKDKPKVFCNSSQALRCLLTLLRK